MCQALAGSDAICQGRKDRFAAVPELTLQLSFSTDQVLAYYRGDARVVRARATTGQMVQFPAGVLQRYVTPDGVHGTFRLVFDENHKLVGLYPVA